jgi:putative ABC transport system ATP-binding protein
MLEAGGAGWPGRARCRSTLSGAGSCSAWPLPAHWCIAPPLVLADEPTGNLDPATATKVMEALVAQTRAQGTSLVLVTHSEAATARADRVLHLRMDGIAGG